jgi:hypothetical protein
MYSTSDSNVEALYGWESLALSKYIRVNINCSRLEREIALSNICFGKGIECSSATEEITYIGNDATWFFICRGKEKVPQESFNIPMYTLENLVA